MKKVLSILTILFGLCISLFAQSEAVKISKLPKKGDFLSDYNKFLENEYYSDHWTPNWNYDKPKESVALELKAFDLTLSSLKKTQKNYDTNLLSLIVKTYLYNLDEIDYQEVVDFANKLKTKYPKEYRTWWILGNFYTSSNPTNLTQEYDTAVKMRGGLETIDDYSAAFLYNYVYGCIMNKTLAHGRYALSLLCELEDTEPQNYFFYNLLYPEEAYVDINQTIPSNQMWKVTSPYSIDDTPYYFFYNTLLGTGFTISGDSYMQLTELSDKTAVISFTSPSFNINSESSTTTTALYLILPDADEQLVNEYVLNDMIMSKEYTIDSINQTTLNDTQIPMTLYTFSNSEIYNDEKNGMKGLFAVFTIPYNEFSGLNLEQPVDYDKLKYQEGNQIKYYSVSADLLRYEGPISFVVLLDACNAIFEPASEWFYNLLGSFIFE